MTMKPTELKRVLDSSTVHDETQGTRIEYDKKSFYLTATYSDNDPFKYDCFDADDNKVKLSDEEQQTVCNFVQNLHDTEKQKKADHQNQF